jgi:FkbM family methyltransferase
MKDFIIYILQFFLGYDNYLKAFSIFKIKTLSLDRRKSDFLFFEKLLCTDANILVIGACTGITTVPLAKDRSHRRIFAYEPLLSNFLVLNNVVKYYRLTNINTYQLGIGNKTEEREILLPIVHYARKHGLAHIKDPSNKDYNTGISEIVRIDCLDNRTELKGITITGMKVVAENFEYQIFEGAKKLLEKSKPLIYCELWNNDKRERVFELIKTLGFDVFYRKQNFLLPYKKGSYTGKNFFFKPILS